MNFAAIPLLLLLSATSANSSTVSKFDVVVVTGTLLAESTVAVAGHEFSVGGSTFIISGGTATFSGLIRKGTSHAWGFNAFTHINLGSFGATGEEGQNYQYATIGGGFSNQAKGSYSSVGGGNTNFAAGQNSFVGGGASNLSQGEAGTVAGGYSNYAYSNYSTVSGGRLNQARGYGAIIPGGESNIAAGDYSFASGFLAKATAKGAFVWADSRGTALSGNTTDQFLIRAQGGFFVETSSATFTGEITLAKDQYVALTGTGGFITSQSSIVASSFFGDGSNLSGVVASGGVAKTGDSMTGSLLMINSSITLTGSMAAIHAGSSISASSLHSASSITTSILIAGSSITGSAFLGDGSRLSGVVTQSGGVLTGGLRLSNSSITLTGNDGYIAMSSSISLSGPTGFLTSKSSVNASGFFGDGSGLTGVTDSGAVRKSGDAMTGPLTLLGSTLTIQGHAFSVGNSTLVVAAGKVGIGTSNPISQLDIRGTVRIGEGTQVTTVTSNGQVQLSAEGIRWADQSTSTSANSFMLRTENQTISGANTFVATTTISSTLRIGPQSHTTTATLTEGLLTNSWMIVASSNASGASSLTFTGLNSSATYRVISTYSKGTQGKMYLRVNGSSSLIYQYATYRYSTNGQNDGVNNSTSYDLISLSGDIEIPDGYPFMSDIVVQQPIPSSNLVFIWGQLAYTNPAASPVYGNLVGTANLSSPLSSVTILPSVGTFTGKTVLLQLIQPPGL